jgi:ABC-2 type transport system permease protein
LCSAPELPRPRADARPAERPAAEPGALGMLWRQYRLERRLFWRNPSAAFFNFLLPLLFLALFGAVFSGNQKDLNVIVPGIAGMSVMSTTFSALAFNMTALRELGVLKRIRGTPMPGGVYLGGIAANAVTNTILQVGIIVVAGRLFFGIPWPRDWGELVVFVVAGVVCFAALGVALSHAIPNFDSAPAYVNAVFLPTIFISGVFYDAKNVPTFLRDIAEALPLKHVIDGLSGAMVTGSGVGSHLDGLGVLLLWGAVGLALAIRGFSWEQRRE